jgi:hypothetical protein
MTVKRYTIQQTAGDYCLKGCHDGDLVDWTSYDALAAELENERMKLDACGVLALSNTTESFAKHNLPRENPYWSGSLSDVANAVQREMALAAELAECRADAERYRWLRQRVEVRQQEAMNGSVRAGLSIRIGSAFLDSPPSLLKSLRDPNAHETRSKELDAALDAARAADSASPAPCGECGATDRHYSGCTHAYQRVALTVPEVKP